MSVPRKSHSSCVLNQHLYVFGGKNRFDPLNSIEKLDLINQTWSLIKVREINERSHCIATPLNSRSVMICGGFCNETLTKLDTGFIFDTFRGEVTSTLPTLPFAFSSAWPSTIVRPGWVVALVEDEENYDIKLVSLRDSS